MARRTLDIDDATWRALRVRAASEDKSLSEVAADAIRAYGAGTPLSFKNAEGVDLFDVGGVKPMRETVRTVESPPPGVVRHPTTGEPSPGAVKPSTTGVDVQLRPEFRPVPKPGPKRK